MDRRLRVLFLCTGNSCRSQMAEAWCRFLKGDVIEAHSAGVEPHGIDPIAVRVMGECGLDISGNRSKKTSDLDSIEFDYVVTVCGSAKEHCPIFPGKTNVVHVGFDDPPALAGSCSNEEEVLNTYRRVRNEIRDFIKTLPEGLLQLSPKAKA